MESNLPQKQEEGLIRKFIKKIIGFFIKPVEEIEEVKEEIPVAKEQSEAIKVEEDFDKKLKVEVESIPEDKDRLREDFLDKLENNPELVDEMSIDQMRLVYQYLKKDIDVKLEYLASQISDESSSN